MKVIIIFALAMPGCANMPLNPYADLSSAGKARQALHAIDFAQTLQTAKYPDCLYESFPVTRKIIGKQPSKQSVILRGVTTSYLSAQLDHYIYKSDLSTGWKDFLGYVMVGVTADTIIKNYGIGIRIGAKPAKCEW
ncbi:MAG: hypothetical protein JKY89_13275 [Immundisolibacteraceae bacterium]|nr:hypothetical protein [Immundisolibacteraceae bacterium]